MRKDSVKVKFGVFIALLFLLWYFGRFFRIDAQALRGALQGFGLIYSGLIFIALYVLVTFFVWFSKDIFRLTAAMLFGAGISTCLVFAAETINACILFSLSRALGRNFVADSLKGRLAGLDRKLSGLSFFWLFLLRFTPLVPFRFLDLSAGITDISFKKYLAAVILGSPLRILWLQSILATLGSAVFSQKALMSYLQQNKILFIFSFAYAILVIVVAFNLKRRK